MKYIEKQSPPAGLTAYCRTPGATYQGLKKKKALYKVVKEALANEQGYICCYCGRRISGKGDTQIEHIFAKGTPVYEEMQLDYETNLLACCDGGKGQRSHILPVIPLYRECESKFLFSEDGEIVGVSKDAEVTVKLLNLNSPVLKNMRKYAIDNYSLCPPADWGAELLRLRKRDQAGAYEEFCFVLESYITTYIHAV